MMITSMITTATTVMAGMVAFSPAGCVVWGSVVGCVLLLTGQVALGLASVVSDMAVPPSLWGSVVGCVLLTVECHKQTECISASLHVCSS